jgi:hypothetical protein
VARSVVMKQLRRCRYFQNSLCSKQSISKRFFSMTSWSANRFRVFDTEVLNPWMEFLPSMQLVCGYFNHAWETLQACDKAVFELAYLFYNGKLSCWYIIDAARDNCVATVYFRFVRILSKCLVRHY